MIYGQNVFSQPVKNNLRTYDNTGKISTGEGDDYTIGCLLDYSYFNEYYSNDSNMLAMIAICLLKQQALDADPKAIQQINLAINLNRTNNVNENAKVFFIIEEAKETVLDFLQGTVKLL